MIRSEELESGRVLRILLDRPKANVLDTPMLTAIDAALTTQTSAATKLLLFEGSGAHFSFGASVAEHDRATAPKMIATFHALFRKLAELAIPTCAVVRGQCLGGGLELATWCSWIVATPDARFGQPEVKLAVFPPMASILLPWRAGGRAALDLCVSGRTVDAATAHTLGIVNAVDDDPEAWWRRHYASELRASSAAALRFAERAARTSLLRDLDETLPRIERTYLEDLMTTYDANEGIGAFLERRPAAFLDR